MRVLTECDISPLWDRSWSLAWRDSRILDFANSLLAEFGGLSVGEVREKEREAWGKAISTTYEVGDSRYDSERDRLYPSLPLAPVTKMVTLSTGSFFYSKTAGWRDAGDRNYPHGPHTRTIEDFEQCVKVMRELA